MPPPVTLHRFQVEITDVDRGIYESVDFRAAQHPSEAPIYLVTRVLAYILSLEEGLAFTGGGLSTPDEPALKSSNKHGGVRSWVDIGNPSARRLHKASKNSERVLVFTYKNPQLLLDDLRSEPIHRGKALEIFSFLPAFLDQLVFKLDRNNTWKLIRNESSLIVNANGTTIDGEIFRHHV